MTPQAKIQKLESLLDRVLARAVEPRSSALTVAAPVAQQLSTATTRMVAPSFPEPRGLAEAARPETEPPATAAEPEMYDDVEVSSEVVEVDIDVDDPMLQSGAHEVPLGGHREEEQEARPDTHRSQAPGPNDEATVMVTGQDEETQMVAPAANEVYEPEPSSSPRPITADVEESSPRHTPPPESGKQIATPSAPPQRKSSVPPPSLEGHTLVGGWREPGLSPQQAAPPVPGVRVPPPPGAQAPPLAPPTPSPPPMQIAAPPVPQASGTRLSPEVTKPDLPARANVATVQGVVEVPKPASFGALVDASLEL